MTTAIGAEVSGVDAYAGETVAAQNIKTKIRQIIFLTMFIRFSLGFYSFSTIIIP